MRQDRVNTGGASPDRGAPRKKKKKRRNIFLIILSLIAKLILAVFTVCLIGVLTVAIFAQYFMAYANNVLVPSLEDVRVEDVVLDLASVIYCKDENDEWVPLRVIHQADGNRELVEYGDLPDHLKKALVAIEDKRFWDHHGVDWISTASSIRDTLLGDSTRGGSTITQQVLRNITQDKEVTVLRKFREIFRALEFEKSNSKEDIMTLYLNTVTFGHAQGIGMAAKVYFGKEVSELDLAESAAIIAITNNPSLYDPFFDIEYPQSDGSIKTPRDFNKKRQEDILWEMRNQGIIDEATYQQAIHEKLLFTDTDEYKALHANDPAEGEDGAETPGEAVDDSDIMPLHTGTYTWFEDAVIDDAIQLIMDNQGVGKEAATNMLYGGGYHIYTTLDLRIQEIVDSVYEDPTNFDFPSKSGQPLASAITVIDPYTGDVVAMSGGVGEKSVNRALNLSRSPRQVGSSIKPVATYAPAIEAGLIGPASVIDDYPIQVNETGTGGYPRNDGGAKYSGPRSITYGVQQSLNCVALQVLQRLGLNRSYEFMKDNLGFNVVEADKAFGALGLGGLTYGLSTEEMAAAYSAFVNEGIYNKPRTILRIESNDHTEVIADNENPDVPRTWVAMKKSTAYLMNQLLRNAANNGTGSRAVFSGMTVAGKTGTANQNYVRYFTGYTPYYCAAVWTGYKDRDERIQANYNPACEVWRLVMEKVHEGLEDKSFFDKPDGITRVTVCGECGLLVSDLCANDYRGTVTGDMPTEAVPKQTCTCHVEVRLCKQEDGTYKLAGPYCPEDTVEIRVMNKGRAFLQLSEDVVNEDGSITYGSIISSTDQENHLTYWNRQGTCAVHDENYVPGNPDDPNGGEPLPGDPDWVPPDWLWGDDTDDTDDTGGSTTPGEPGEPDDDTDDADDTDDTDDSGGTDSPDDSGTPDDSGGQTEPEGTTTPGEPGGTPGEPDEPSNPTI